MKQSCLSIKYDIFAEKRFGIDWEIFLSEIILSFPHNNMHFYRKRMSLD